MSATSIEVNFNLERDSLEANILTKTKRIEADFTGLSLDARDYNRLANKPSINGVTLQGDLTSEDLDIDPNSILPKGGNVGDILVRTNGDSVGWETPANSAEADNTRPITAAAVYTEIGNINALLATI